MIRLIFHLTIIVLWTTVTILAAEDISDELQYSTESNNEQRLTNIYSVEGNCRNSTCRGFYFPDVSNVAFFALKPKIRILDHDTYVFKDPFTDDEIVFLNSTFAHFPLNFFYTASNIREMDIRNCSVKSVTWENFLKADKLQILLLSQNKLTNITESTFGYASELQYLFLDENRLRFLDSKSFQGLSKLQYLNLAFNRLKDLHPSVFFYTPELRELNLEGNRLHFLPNEIFSQNNRLKNIVLRNNKLRQLDEYVFKNKPNMIYLDISHNTRLGRLILNVETQNFQAKNCSLYLINLYGNIVNADLRDNQIVELYFAQPENLETLVLRNNALQQIASLAKATSLSYLDIADNPALEYLPDPWSVNSLEHLDLSNTSMSVLPISNLAEQTNLRWLNVSSNKLRDINPQNFQYLEKLEHFDIAGNNWNCYNLRLLMDLLIKPNKIVYKYDVFNADFPGEYIEGIACMYRIDDEIESADDELTTSNEKLAFETIANLKEPIAQSTSNTYESTNEYPTEGDTEAQKLRNEIKTLRNELKAIVSFYESKFDVVFDKMESLNQRIAAFERMNATMFQHITIST